MITGQPAWILLALLGGASGVAFFAVLRGRLIARHNPRSKKDGWERGRLALAGFTLSILALGAGMGGAMAARPWAMDEWWSSLIQLGPEPLGEIPSAAPATGEGIPEWHSIHPPEPAVPAEDPPTPPVEEPPPAPADTDPSPDTGSVAAPEAPAPFGVRVGVYRRTANVDAVAEELRRAGYDPLVVRREDAAGAPVFYLYAGAWPTRAEAEEAAREIRGRGGDAMVVEIRSTGSGR